MNSHTHTHTLWSKRRKQERSVRMENISCIIDSIYMVCVCVCVKKGGSSCEYECECEGTVAVCHSVSNHWLQLYLEKRTECSINDAEIFWKFVQWHLFHAGLNWMTRHAGVRTGEKWGYISCVRERDWVQKELRHLRISILYIWWCGA